MTGAISDDFSESNYSEQESLGFDQSRSFHSWLCGASYVDMPPACAHWSFLGCRRPFCVPAPFLSNDTVPCLYVSKVLALYPFLFQCISWKRHFRVSKKHAVELIEFINCFLPCADLCFLFNTNCVNLAPQIIGLCSFVADGSVEDVSVGIVLQTTFMCFASPCWLCSGFEL